jgi:phage baseplate assembly protein gpV
MKNRARLAAEAADSASSRITFQSTWADLAPGVVFGVEGHPHPELAPGQRLLVVESWLSGGSADEMVAGGEAVAASKPFRPTFKPSEGKGGSFASGSSQEKPSPNGPKINGVQSAIVVGPKGEEVHADELGRIRIQFAWDREGQFDEKSSSWVRVAQASAGAGAGTFDLPRVGDEVLVAFVDGDPNLPVVVGRLHNPTSPTPYSVPDHKTRATWKGRAGNGSANEITFEDKVDGGLFYVQAQHDLHKLVMQHEREHTLGDRHVSVDGDLILSAKGRIIIQSGEDVVLKGAPLVKLNPGEAPPSAVKPLELSTGQAKQGPESEAAKANERLFAMDPGEQPAARDAARSRIALAEQYKPLAETLGQKHGLPPAFLLGWMSQESGLGSDLDDKGFSKADGFGFGLMQVDKRYHTPGGDPFGEGGAEQGINVLKQHLATIEKAHPAWTSEQKLAGALVEYNAGNGTASAQPLDPMSWARMDAATAPDGGYSRAVFAQAQWFAQNLKW